MKDNVYEKEEKTEREMHVMDICTGIGGFSLALKWLIGGFRTVCYIEIDEYCQQVIKARIKDAYLEDAPTYGDLRTFDGKPWRGCVDLITAGFPCQPFSVAGQQKGEADERNLWPDVWRICSEVRPRFIFLENVPALLAHRYIQRIFGDLVEGGYDCRWRILSAAEVGAPHLRNRLWIYCHTNREGESAQSINAEMAELSENVADAKCGRTNRGTCRSSWWTMEPKETLQNARQEKGKGNGFSITESLLGRVAHGVPARVDRLKALGNAIVPAVAAKAWEILKGEKRDAKQRS